MKQAPRETNYPLASPMIVSVTSQYHAKFTLLCPHAISSQLPTLCHRLTTHLETRLWAGSLINWAPLSRNEPVDKVWCQLLRRGVCVALAGQAEDWAVRPCVILSGRENGGWLAGGPHLARWLPACRDKLLSLWDLKEGPIIGALAYSRTVCLGREQGSRTLPSPVLISVIPHWEGLIQGVSTAQIDQFITGCIQPS